MSYTYDKYLNTELAATTVDELSDDELRDLILELTNAFRNETRTGAAFVGRNLATAVERVLTAGRKVRVIWRQDELPSLRASDKRK